MIDVQDICKKTKKASYDWAGMDKDKKNDILLEIVKLLSDKGFEY